MHGIKVRYKVITSLVLVIIWWSLSISLTRVTNAQRGRLTAGYKYPGQCPGPGHHTWCSPPVHLVLTLQLPHWESYGQSFLREDTNQWVGSLRGMSLGQGEMTLNLYCIMDYFLHFILNTRNKMRQLIIECTEHIMLKVKHSLPPLVTWSDNVKH